MHQVGIRGDSGGDLSRAKLVEVGNVLAQDGLQIFLPDLRCDMVTRVYEADRGGVDQDKLSDGEVDKIKDFAVDQGRE